jgi:hypothetical protein
MGPLLRVSVPSLLVAASARADDLVELRLARVKIASGDRKADLVETRVQLFRQMAADLNDRNRTTNHTKGAPPTAAVRSSP